MASEQDEGSRGDRRGPRGRGGPGATRGGPGGRGRGRRGPRGRSANRGDVRAAILALLTEEPMHGYQIMQELIDRSRGAWQPSPGSVYPTLQQLADEGLVRSSDEDGRKVFELTADGRTAAEASSATPPWERLAAAAGSIDLRHTMSSVGAATRQVAANGTKEQVEKAAEILTEARKRLYQLLAE